MDNLSYIATWPHALCGEEGHFKKIAKEKKVGIAWLAGTLLLLLGNALLSFLLMQMGGYSSFPATETLFTWVLESLVAIAVLCVAAKVSAKVAERKGDWRNETTLLAPSIYMITLYVMVANGILDYANFAFHYSYANAAFAANALVVLSAVHLFACAAFSRFKAGGAKNAEAIAYSAAVMAALAMAVAAAWLVILMASGLLNPAPVFVD